MTAIASQSTWTPQQSSQVLATLPDMTTHVGQLAHYGSIRARLLRPHGVIRVSRTNIPPPPPEPAYADAEMDCPVNMLTLPSWRVLVKLAARRHGVTVKEVMAFGRSRNIAAARHEAAYLLRSHTGLSLTEIGRRLNRDHSTILNSIRTHKENLAKGANHVRV